MTSPAVRPLTVEFDRSGRNLTAYLAGDLDALTAAGLAAAVLSALDDRLTRVVLDLSTLTFCDSAGLAAFSELNAAAGEIEANLILQDPSPTIRRMFEIVGLDELISVVGIAR